jgi:ParB family chromosome partitioning protein
MKISLDKITPDPRQPRKLFDAGKLQELADSIAENGLMQAIEVRKADQAGCYWITAGERRYRAHCILRDRGMKGFATIEATVKEPSNTADLRVRQIVENVARADLSPLEEARSYRDLMDEGLSDADAARKLGITLTKFQRAISLLGLDETVTKLLAGGQLEAAQAFELARLPNQADQVRLVRMINRGEIGKWKTLAAAVDAILGNLDQNDMFGPGAPAASEEDVKAVNAMEAKIERVAGLLSSGWSRGACIVANKVSPDRAALMADKLAAIRSTVRAMEISLRSINSQIKIVMEA